MTVPKPRASATTWQLLDELDRPRDGAEQMRVDLDMLERVDNGEAPALRVYTWGSPTLSIGRFQAETDVDHDSCRRLEVEVVRRPTGGAALLHGADLTYAVAMPRPTGHSGTVDATYETIAWGLLNGLARLGVDAAIAHHGGPRGAVCFSAQQGADLRVGTQKICGSAQLRHAGAVLQHGSVLLRRLPFDETDLVTGDHDRDALRRSTVTLEELDVAPDPRPVADAVIAGFAEALCITFERTTVVMEPVNGR